MVLSRENYPAGIFPYQQKRRKHKVGRYSSILLHSIIRNALMSGDGMKGAENNQHKRQHVNNIFKDRMIKNVA